MKVGEEMAKTQAKRDGFKSVMDKKASLYREVQKKLDSEKCTIGGQRCQAARIRTWNLPESSF